ncbi:MAG: hypothetical protein UR62_C0007G0022 [Candidatus Nomurabacteria bacterium GW2011_GWF2_35_12]|uniref:Lipoprotein n=1 Tax=Candidatus Nomurabacteria bacterium GW2011_GWA1_36_15 TaxID=1618728 RepID=A0A0G0E999_9BACT|nr:MAG: hypothetical protein UR62_C0007G0022 [Candidatus Nomurabacteria bacterium GW2011_GWF2_35_12]KKP76324.1 MAG: hypothetical protein UR72_C0003G0023 [Parcubacteria group bacterium GW2011_GWC1_35_21]KKP77825.1 MAG: hypothetical protein UR77_C0013G0011 [Candidatus Nomurabacteria bacterium GW2011_GWC2_35_35]KKP85386.1 MAG: hypothetical protein UR86_C0005G0009 [Parcubacteria group bacterium GW2011_GWD2_35_7]KKP97661.1 MAG: hypothetical protein US05_C0013G0018 [Candidatus Nomurabacteria bacteriu
MKNNIFLKIKSTFVSTYFWFFVFLLLILASFFVAPEFFSTKISNEIKNIIAKPEENKIPILPPLDTVAYDKKLNELANNPLPVIPVVKKDKNGNTITPIETPVSKINLWPVKTVYPNTGAILPFNRVVAYYGNLYSKNMGALGQYGEDEMIERLGAEVKEWQKADSLTPVIPALHYIAVVAQAKAGEDGKYRIRMPDSEIDKVIEMAKKINALVFLDIQVGFSNLQTEIPLLEKYLKMPQVHLGVDPEFSMKTDIRPGKIVGTLDASDINFAANYLAKIVKENNLTPKILVIHRYTQKMVTNYKEIKPLPEVQVVMHMDGWGGAAKKINTYQQFIYKEPVQFTGFKLFYKNDVLEKGTTLMIPNDLLKLNPQPIYIQYQ